jgi:hypothetical protein
MGNRVVYGFKDELGAGTLYLYAHWGREDGVDALREAVMAARGRWDDPAYATRICVSHLIGDKWQQETGFGLSVGSLTDSDHPILIVDWVRGVVEFGGAGGVSESLVQFTRAMQDA